jgi:hypothetical protein
VTDETTNRAEVFREAARGDAEEGGGGEPRRFRGALLHSTITFSPWGDVENCVCGAHQISRQNVVRPRVSRVSLAAASRSVPLAPPRRLLADP